MVLRDEHELDSVSDSSGDSIGTESKTSIGSNHDLLGSSKDRCGLHQCKSGRLGEMHLDVGNLSKN